MRGRAPADAAARSNSSMPPELLNPARAARRRTRRRAERATPPAQRDADTADDRMPAGAPPAALRRRRRHHHRPLRPARRRRAARHAAVSTAATGLKRSSRPPAACTDPLRPLPFAFAKRHGVLVRAVSDDAADVVVATAPRRSRSPRCAVTCARLCSSTRRRRARSRPCCARSTRPGSGIDAWTRWAASRRDRPRAPGAGHPGAVRTCSRATTRRPIIRLINALLTQAVKENASDIHIEPFENRLVVRFRVDGVLREVLQTKRAVAPLVVSRIKVMSRLDIAEKRLPQDGRISLRIAGRAVDVRVSTIPAGHGERVVLRLLDKQAGRLDLAQLGMDAGDAAAASTN